MTIVELKTRPREVVASVVQRLEELLTEAREGKITAVAIAALRTDRAISATWSETDDFAGLLGAVARLEYRLNAEQPMAEERAPTNRPGH